MSPSQAEFAHALRTPGADRPEGLSDGTGRPATRRFDVYRNNVTVALTEALETSFPCLRKLVGAGNFRLLARAFLAAHPPSSPLMMFYGAEMADFVAAFPPTRAIGYLPDIARLELAMRTSYHAADAAPADPGQLQGLAPDALMAARIGLVPSLQLLRSDWPIHAIWRFNMVPEAPKPEMAAQDVLILRPDLDPELHLLPSGGAAFVAALARGRRFGDALAAAEAQDSAFDLAPVLTLLIAGRALHVIGDDTCYEPSSSFPTVSSLGSIRRPPPCSQRWLASSSPRSC
jgi:hypothetical protein